MLDGPQVVRVLDLPEEQGVVPVRLHRVGRDDGPVQRQRGQQRLEVADLVRLPGLGDLVLADHDAGDVGDRGEQVHLLLPAGLGALALLAVDRDALARGNVPGIPAGGGVQPGVLRVRPEPAVLPLLPEGFRGRRLPLLPLLLLLALLLRAVRGIRGRDRRIQRRVRQRPGQRGLELVRVQHPEPVQHRRRRRHPQPGPRADPAAVRGQHLLVPALRRLRHRQRPAMPARRARRHHRDQRRQRMPLPPLLPRIGQPALQRPPQRPRLKRRPGQVAADSSISDDGATGAAFHGDVSDG